MIRRVSIKQLTIFLILLTGLLVALYLVQQRLTLQSRAYDTILNVVEVSGEGVEQVSEDTWKTESLDVTIGFTDLEALLNE